MHLDHSQEAAVRHGKGPALIIAGPGSGKTAVITSRIKYLTEQCRIPAESILVMTFSRKAAEQMKDRFLQLRTGCGLPFFGTFHSVFFMILRYAYNLTSRNIISEERKKELLQKEVDKLCLEYENSPDFFSSLLGEISKVKSRPLPLESYFSSTVPPRAFHRIFAGYSSALSREGLIDFDDMISICLTLLEARADILSWWQNRFRFILIDEFQDISPVQYQILRMLALPENNLFAVGDDDQSIYAFRGASPDIMIQFLSDYPTARRITLNRNYRCPPLILSRSVQVISQNKNRFAKKLVSGRSADEPASFRICGFPDQQTEYRSMAEEIHHLLADGTSPEQIAVLLRSTTDLPFLLHALAQQLIPTEISSPVSGLYEHFIAGDLAAYLRLAENLSGLHCTDPNQIKTDLYRIINKPSRYISRKSLYAAELSGMPDTSSALSGLRKYYRKDGGKTEALWKLDYHLRMLAGQTPYAAVKYLRNAVGYEDYLRENAKRNRRDPDYDLLFLDAIEEDFRSRSLEEVREAFLYPPPDGPFLSVKDPFLPSAVSGTDPAPSGGVRLMTIHASKGLEFPFVFIPDANEDVIPTKKAETPAAMEEERRIFYVAMTRASQSLNIFYCEKIHRKKAAPSRFVDCFL